jgi:hypothetical protein
MMDFRWPYDSDDPESTQPMVNGFISLTSITIADSPVPEPSSLTLTGIAGLAMLGYRLQWSHRKKETNEEKRKQK